MDFDRKTLTCYFAEFTDFGFMDKERLAIKICEKLQSKGYIAYYAGGYVRDMILKIPSDDIDIATDAAPETVQALFKKTILVGLSFGIVVVVVDGVSFEIATFRKDLHYKDGRRPEEIAFCSPKEDAQRRDFTINGMFYDPLHKKIFDYVDGKRDLEKGILRAIGDPKVRFTEDRLRMVRACRFSARFNFPIEKATKEAILDQAHELFPSVSIERIYQEFKKMKSSCFKKALILLFEMNLLQQIFPLLNGYSPKKFHSCVKSFDQMPNECPTILYLLDLFPEITRDELEDVLDYLKVSNTNTKLALFCWDTKKIIQTELTKKKRVQLYANPDIELVLKVIAAPLSAKRRIAFLEENAKFQIKLRSAIERKKTNNPIVSSKFLMDHGVVPGKKLGKLLEKAEEIAIENNLDDPNQILKELHVLKLWGESP
ncbi:MAG: CCA-adding enzyme [Chlamydiae bacterium]|nr:CCA-adding enzyme [Chlamydiota bacterium]